MANKPFAIQGADLTLGGINLQAGTTGVVIPGVTQAANYRVEEVEDTDDQTYSNFPTESTVVVIDAALYNTIVAEGNESTFADFTATTDDEGYIDEIEVNGRGTYTQQQSTTAGGNDMYAYVGSSSASDRPLVLEDWIQIPFRPKMRAGEVENIGGGGGSSEQIIYDEDVTNRVEVNADGARVRLNTQLAEEDQTVWQFGTDGDLTFPDGTVQTTAYTGQSGGGSGTA
jgi:hypothetical protein